MMFRKIITLFSFLTALCFLAGVSLAAPKDNKDSGVRSGLIQNPYLVYNEVGALTELQIPVVLPKSLDSVWAEQAEAWLVVWITPDEESQGPVPLRQIQLTGKNAANGGNPRQVITISGGSVTELNALPKGEYQLGLVLTNLNGNPTTLSDWYGGFSGLISVARFKITLGSDTPTGPASGGESSGGEEGGSSPPMAY